MKFFRNNPLEKFFFVINNTIIINNIRDKKIDKSNYCTNLLRVWYRVKIKIKLRIFDKHFKLENYSQQYWFQNLDSITKLLDQASNLNITSNCQKITQQRSKIPKKFLNCSIDAQKKTHRTSFNDLIINSSANHAICHNWKISLFNALVRAKYPPQISQKRGGAEKGGEKGGRERKKEFERESETSERKKNKSSSLLAVDNVGVRLHRDTYRNELVYRRCVKLQRKRGRGRRSHGNWSEKLVEECWKEKGDEESWKYWKESTVPRLSITSSHFIIFCAHISVFGVDSVQSTGHDESAYLEVAIKLTIGRKREVLLISFPSPLSSPPRRDHFDLVANPSVLQSSRDF